MRRAATSPFIMKALTRDCRNSFRRCCSRGVGGTESFFCEVSSFEASNFRGEGKPLERETGVFRGGNGMERYAGGGDAALESFRSRSVSLPFITGQGYPVLSMRESRDFRSPSEEREEDQPKRLVIGCPL